MVPMSPEIKRHLISGGVTFVSVLLIAIVPVLTDPAFTWTGAAFSALFVAALRSAVKVTWEKAILPLLQP